MHRTWKDNADEFAALDSGEGWPFARLVACSVEKGKGNGRPAKTISRERVSGKTGAGEFAKVAGTSNDRVLRYLACWQRAAEQGVVPDADTLSPEDAEGMTDPEVSWLLKNGSLRFGDPAKPSGGRPRDSKPEDAATIIERRGAAAVVDALSEEQKQEVREALGGPTPQEVADAVLTNPAAADAADAALTSHPTKTQTGRAHREAEQRRAEEDGRSAENGTDLLIKIQFAVDELAKYGHWERLDEAIAYAEGVRDSRNAGELTPEMFQ